MKTQPLYAILASLIQARLNCIQSNNQEWLAKHTANILELVKDHMPSGSGIDHGTTIDLEASTPDKIILHTGFHHMNENGMYDGWTTHTLTVTPSLQFGFNLKIAGRDRNQIKEYLHEVYSLALDEKPLELAQPAISDNLNQPLT